MWYELNGWEIPTDNAMWEEAKEKYANHKPYTLLFQCSFQRMELFQAENLMQLLEQHGYMWKLDEPVREAWQQMDTGSVYWWLIMQQGV